jgi:membrane protein
MGLLDRVRALVERIGEDDPDAPAWMRIGRGLLAVEARDRVLILAGQGFVALVPLMIVIATLVSADEGLTVAERMAESLGLDESTAEEVRRLFRRPPDAGSGVGVFSWVLVLISVSSFARSIRRTFERAWTLPVTRGLRSSVEGLVGVLVLVAAVLATGWIDRWGALAPGTWVADLVLTAAGWLLACHLFLGRRTRWRAVLPGAAYGALASSVAGWGVGVYVPGLMGRYLDRYGLIGVSFALITWLIIVASVIVSVAVVSAQLAPPGRVSDHPDQEDEHQQGRHRRERDRGR